MEKYCTTFSMAKDFKINVGFLIVSLLHLEIVEFTHFGTPNGGGKLI